MATICDRCKKESTEHNPVEKHKLVFSSLDTAISFGLDTQKTFPYNLPERMKKTDTVVIETKPTDYCRTCRDQLAKRITKTIEGFNRELK